MTTPAPDAEPREEAVQALQESFTELVAVFRRLIADAADAASPGMLAGTFKVFSAIDRSGPVTLSALAEKLHADKGQISRSVSELEELGFVERTDDPADRRSRLISVTARGAERLERARRPQRSRLTETLAQWSVEDIRNAATILSALAQGRPPHDED